MQKKRLLPMLPSNHRNAFAQFQISSSSEEIGSHYCYKRWQPEKNIMSQNRLPIFRLAAMVHFALHFYVFSCGVFSGNDLPLETFKFHIHVPLCTQGRNRAFTPQKHLLAQCLSNIRRNNYTVCVLTRAQVAEQQYSSSGLVFYLFGRSSIDL